MQKTELLYEGDDFYRHALDAIEESKLSVAFMVYIWQNDEIGMRFEDALTNAAKRGVYVRLVIDAIGSLELPNRVVARLVEAGVHVFIHHKLRIFRWGWLRFLIRRNHRKIIIVDDTVAFAGGFNLMRECSREAYGSARWLDAVIVSSSRKIIDFLTEQFEDACRRARHEKWASRLLTRTGNKVLHFDENHTGSYSLSRYIKHRLRRAKERIVISVPYFVPYGFWFRILVQKLREGVTIEIILSRKSDLPWIDAVSFSLAKRLMKKGAKVFLYSGTKSTQRFSHTKILLVDSWVLTGSANYDYRSMVLNLETMLAFRKAPQGTDVVYRELSLGSKIALLTELKGGFRAWLLKPFYWLL
ncbi:MAG: Cardiolipin synthase B [Turneriella sp.]|nr:Cardiolipin synthase B [Turneriella sp.]